MDPLSAAIDKVEDLIGHSPHPAIVALPVGAWAVSNVCDALALATGDDRYDDAARISMAVGLVGAAGAVVTGIRDYGDIPEDRPSHATAQAHGLGNGLVTSLFAASYFLRSLDHQRGRPASNAARALGLLAGGLATYTAWLGGVLVMEHGEGVKPVTDRLDPDDERHGRERLAADSPLGRQMMQTPFFKG